jgi:hypothetical protein
MTRPTLSRRAFLRLALLTGIGAGAAYLEHLSQPVGTVTYVRWLLSGAYRQVLGKPALVALGECPSYQGRYIGYPAPACGSWLRCPLCPASAFL